MFIKYYKLVFLDLYVVHIINRVVIHWRSEVVTAIGVIQMPHSTWIYNSLYHSLGEKIAIHGEGEGYVRCRYFLEEGNGGGKHLTGEIRRTLGTHKPIIRAIQAVRQIEALGNK